VPTSSRATVHFVARPTRDAEGPLTWQSGREALAHFAREAEDTSPQGTPPDVVGIWRLLASNHRELARGATTFTSFDEALSTVVSWQSLHEKFDVSTFHGPRSGTHGWSVSIEGAVIFTAARWFETGAMNLDSCSASIAAFCGARVSDTPWNTAAQRRTGAARTAVAV
jgi:hypothetical protein